MELLGITNYPPTAQSRWWKPDGSAASLGPFRSRQGKTHYSFPPDKKSLTFLLHYTGLPTDASHAAWQLTPSSHNWEATAVQNAEGEKLPDYDMFSFSAENGTSTMATADFRVGKSVGTWDTVATQRADSAGTSNFTRDGRKCSVTFQKATAGPSAGTTQVTLTTDVGYGKLQTQVVAVARDGSQEGAIRTSFWGQHGTVVFDLPLSAVKEFRFKVRPYYWVEFKNVSFQPGQNTAVKVVSFNESANTSTNRTK